MILMLLLEVSGNNNYSVFLHPLHIHECISTKTGEVNRINQLLKHGRWYFLDTKKYKQLWDKAYITWVAWARIPLHSICSARRAASHSSATAHPHPHKLPASRTDGGWTLSREKVIESSELHFNGTSLSQSHVHLARIRTDEIMCLQCERCAVQTPKVTVRPDPRRLHNSCLV